LTPKGKEIYENLSELVQNPTVQQAILNTEAFERIHKSFGNFLALVLPT
jgi:hypothetical protein